MNDVSSKLKTPEWGRVVAELARPAGDDMSFLRRLASVLGQVSGARRATLVVVPAGSGEGVVAEPRAVFAWPTEPGASGVAADRDTLSAARSAAERGASRVFGVEDGEGGGAAYYTSGPSGYLVGLPIGFGGSGAGGPVPVVVLALDARSPQALSATLALVEVLAGYVHTHAAHQQLGRLRSAGAALDLAARLIASINNAPTFKGAAMQAANDLMRQLQLDRVALGWTHGLGRRGEGERVKLVALSDTEHVDRRMAMVRGLEAAMDECLDQEQAVLYPPPPERDTGSAGSEDVSGSGTGEPADVLLSQAVVHAHKALASGDAQLRVASVPLRAGEDVVGVLTVELGGGASGASAGAGARQGPALDANLVELLQAVMDLVAPVLRIRRSDDRNVALRGWDSALATGAWAVGPRHTAWKLLGVAAIALVTAILVVKAEYRIEAPVELRPIERRTVSVPFSGIISEVPEGIEAGALVEAGDVLLVLDTTELRLQAIDTRAQLRTAETERDQASRERKLGEAQQADARAEQSRARLALLEQRIEDATVRAPIAGTILAGDVRDVRGSAVELGQALFEIAPLDQMRVVARVDDRDIGLVSLGQSGSVATKAYPGRRFPMTVERVVPLATPSEGGNTFEVHATLDGSAAWMRPGMEGLCKLDTGERTLAEIGARRVVDTLRLWLWW
ncbi:MAG: HlyD family efflux transporter periplasmic adaptor subunit [Phycisphaerales bacterium]|nr:MAG: HlyD family efflux transporter periplasmic adaptor subunit [Phycisphaerales bacterium]